MSDGAGVLVLAAERYTFDMCIIVCKWLGMLMGREAEQKSDEKKRENIQKYVKPYKV